MNSICVDLIAGGESSQYSSHGNLCSRLKGIILSGSFVTGGETKKPSCLVAIMFIECLVGA